MSTHCIYFGDIEERAFIGRNTTSKGGFGIFPIPIVYTEAEAETVIKEFLADADDKEFWNPEDIHLVEMGPELQAIVDEYGGIRRKTKESHLWPQCYEIPKEVFLQFKEWFESLSSEQVKSLYNKGEAFEHWNIILSGNLLDINNRGYIPEDEVTSYLYWPLYWESNGPR